MNMYQETNPAVATLLKTLGAPFRLDILSVIGKDETCVCHLESVLGKRQAYISQHLMILRDAGVLTSRREGKYVYYRVADTRLFDVLDTVMEMLGIAAEDRQPVNEQENALQCGCPNCDESKK